MAEPVGDRPHGFYTAPEYLYELQGQLLRAARVRIDVGLHTKRMTFDEAMNYFTEYVNFFPGRLRARGSAILRRARSATARCAPSIATASGRRRRSRTTSARTRSSICGKRTARGRGARLLAARVPRALHANGDDTHRVFSRRDSSQRKTRDVRPKTPVAKKASRVAPWLPGGL